MHPRLIKEDAAVLLSLTKVTATITKRKSLRRTRTKSIWRMTLRDSRKTMTVLRRMRKTRSTKMMSQQRVMLRKVKVATTERNDVSVATGLFRVHPFEANY